METFVAALRQVSEALRWKPASLPMGPIRRLSSKLGFFYPCGKEKTLVQVRKAAVIHTENGGLGSECNWRQGQSLLFS